jgi:2-dehydropantoate 2-reductase
MDPLYVVGAGGIGCAVGYALCSAGAAVTFVDADPAKIDWGRAHGVRVDGLAAQRVEFEPFEHWVPPAGATVLLCTKCYDNDVVLARLPAGVTLIPIQNGFDPALDTRGHWVEGIASFVSECDPHRTHTRITRAGRLHFGRRLAARDPPPLPSCVRLLAGGSRVVQRRIRVELVPDILPYKYTKLMYNAAISPLASVAGLDNGQLLSVPKARRLFFALLRENYAILRDAGVRLGKIGAFHPDTVARILRRVAVSRVLAWAFYPTLRHTYCSMARDLPAGRTEIEFYNRHLIDRAGDRPCPFNRRLYELVKHIERERIPPRVELLDGLLSEPALV